MGAKFNRYRVGRESSLLPEAMAGASSARMSHKAE